MSGTVNISRDIWHDVAFRDDPFTEREAFMWLIMEASYKAREKRIGNITVHLERGQLATSVRFMCQAWDWSKSRVDRYLKRLEKRDMIGTESGTGVSIITVCKYDEYQSPISDSGTGKNQKRDSSGTAAGQQRDKPNKGLFKGLRREEANASSVHPDTAQQDFQDFWDAYPHRNGKKNRKGAEKAFFKAIKSGASIQQIADGVSRMRMDPDVQRGFSRDPTTWLNQQGWTDEFSVKPIVINGGHENGLAPDHTARTNPNRPGHAMVSAFASVAQRRSGG